MRVGLLGGSFNPAHRGHVHISRLALDRLRLDAVWWIVSPQNPLKSTDGMAPFADRLIGAARVAAVDERILVSDLENRLGTRYAVDTLAVLIKEQPGTQFVWVMGADNLLQVPRWKQWRRLFRMLPIAVFARPSYSFRALSSRATRRFAAAQVRESRAAALAGMSPPAWVYLNTRLDYTSATRIRAEATRAGTPGPTA
jgi:nicotinate-nucleotide adenylyltransferase